MSIIAVFAASTIESRPIERLMRRSNRRVTEPVVEGRIGDNHVVLVKTGMGMAPARSAAKILDEKNAAVIVTGLCGSLSSDVMEGQVVLYSDCLADDARRALACSREFVFGVASMLERSGVSTKVVQGLSSKTIAATPSEKRALSSRGAEVVDTESYEILAAAHCAGIPAIILRAVSDSVDRTLPDFGPAIRDNGEFAPLRLARACLSSPIRTIQLYMSTRRAIENLSRAQAVILGGDLVELCAFNAEAASTQRGSQKPL